MAPPPDPGERDTLSSALERFTAEGEALPPRAPEPAPAEAWRVEPPGLPSASAAAVTLPDGPDGPAEAPGEALDREDPSLPPRAEAPFALAVVAGPAAGVLLGVGRRPVVVGRELGALKVEDPFISEGHASFQVRGGRLVVVDGGGPSGVYVSVPPVVPLEPGQYFAAGLQVFRFLGPLEGPGPAGVHGSPYPHRAFRLEQVLVGDRGGRVVLFRYSASIGRSKGTFQFPDDELLEDVHAELKPGKQGMELVTHARQGAVYLRVRSGGEAELGGGDLVRMGTSTLRVVAR